MERFLRNVILGEKNELRNRDMLVGVSLPTTSAQSKLRQVPDNLRHWTIRIVKLFLP